MSKKLTPLKRLKIIKLTWNCLNPNFSEAQEEDFDIIKTALKENKYLEEQNKYLGRRLENFESGYNLQKIELEENQKKLKAFEIIKEKRVDITTLFDCCNAKEYNRWVDVRSHYTYRPFELTQQEYDLLKEVLKDE